MMIVGVKDGTRSAKPLNAEIESNCSSRRGE